MPKDKTVSHEKIISAARKEFLDRGFEDASMRRIAADAGLTVSALYKHFPGKEEMFAALVQPVIDAFAPFDNVYLAGDARLGSTLVSTAMSDALDVAREVAGRIL